MAKTFGELQALALQIRDEILEKKNTAPRVGAALLDMIDNTIQNITDINQKLSVFEHACSGFKRVESESQLPVTPPEDEKAVGYLVGKNLYLYVGKDGNAVNGRYFNVGDITGPKGEIGPQGIKGDKGDKGEQGNSGVSGSTDNIEVVNNLEGGESTPERIKVLAAEQGKVLNGKFSELDNYKLLKWNTDNSTTRNQVVLKERKEGMLIRYQSTEGWVNEFYKGTKIDNVNWGHDNNWERYVTQKQIKDLTPALALSKDRFKFGDYVTVNNAILYNSSISYLNGSTLLICEVKPIGGRYRVVVEEGVKLKCITQLSKVPESYSYNTNLTEFITSYILDPKSNEFTKDETAIAIAITVMDKVPTSASYFEPIPYNEEFNEKIGEIESDITEIKENVESNTNNIDSLNTTINGKKLTPNNYNQKTDNAIVNGNYIRAIEGYTLCFFTVDEKQMTLTANGLQYIESRYSAYLTEIPPSIKYNVDITTYKISEGNFVEGEEGFVKPNGCKCIAIAFKDGYTEETYLKINGIASQNIDVSSLQGKLIPKHIFYGKKCTYAGDSLFADPPTVIQRVSELLGLEYNAEETKLTCKGGSMTLGVDDNCGMMRVRRIEAFEKQPDIIIYENVNDNGFGRNKGSIEDKPFMLSKFYDKETSVASLTAVKEYFSTNFDTLTTEFTAKVGAMIRLGYISQSFTFTVNSKATTNGTIKITIDDQEFGIEVTTDTEISEIVNLIATQPFEDKGLKLTKTTENTCVYNNKTDSSISLPTFNSNGTGVDISITENKSKINFGYCFMSHDVSKWKDQSEWQAYNEVTGFSVYKGLFEYLMTTFKKAWIFMTITPDWYVFNWDSPDPTYLRPDGTFDWDKLKKQWDVWHYGELNNFYRDVCKYMKVPVLDTEHESCINIYNASEYYPTNNVHFNQKAEGVERIAQSMVRCLLR